MGVQFLLFGHDTIECAYYLAALSDCSLDFTRLAVEKESLRLAKIRRPKAIKLGSQTFLLAAHGIAATKRHADMPAIRPRQVELFCWALKEKLHEQQRLCQGVSASDHW